VSWPFGRRAGFGFALGFFGIALLAGWALDAGGDWLAAILGIVALAVYWRATLRYAAWATSGEQTASGSRLGVCAGVGIVACVLGAGVLALASDHDARAPASLGIALVGAGLIPIMHAIRYEPEPAQQRPWEDVAFGWVLNTLFAFAALAPGLLVVGAPVAIAALVPTAWLASVALNRLARFRWYRRFGVPILAIVALGSAIGFLIIPDPGTRVALTVGLLLLFLGCVDGISAPIRRSRAVDWSSTRTAVTILLVATALIAAVLTRVNVLEHVPLLAATVVVLVCFGFGGSYIRRGQGLAVLALLAALTLWVIADRDDDAPADPTPNGRGTVVALGDSYASGEGAKVFLPGTNVQDGNHCRRSSDAYGYRVARALGSHLEFLACSGAIATEIWQTAQVPRDAAGDDIGKLPQLDNPVEGTPDLVLISIGGNDALFGAVGRGCALPGSCVDIKHIFDGNLPSVGAGVATALGKVADRFPDSPILVVPYPQMLPEPAADGTAPGDCAGVPLGGKELEYLRGFVAALDAQVEQAVVAVNQDAKHGAHIRYFDAGERAYAGHRICGPGNGDSAVNTLAIAPTGATDLFDRLVPTNWTHNSFHPTEVGHDLLTAELVPWIREHVPAYGAATRLPTTTEARTAPSLAEENTCTGREKCTEEVNAWSTGRTIEAIRSVFPYAVLLGLLGWLLAAVRRLPLRT
jgi:lysophospholipase L1-like esterase